MTWIVHFFVATLAANDKWPGKLLLLAVPCAAVVSVPNASLHDSPWRPSLPGAVHPEFLQVASVLRLGSLGSLAKQP